MVSPAFVFGISNCLNFHCDRYLSALGRSSFAVSLQYMPS